MKRHGTLLAAATVVAFAVAGPAIGAAPEAAPLAIDGPAYKAPWVRYGDWTKDQWTDFNTLREERSPPPGEVIRIEGEIVGDAEKGRALAFDRRRGGSCLACHTMGTTDLPGNVGPDLSEIGNAGLSDEDLYNIVYDRRVFNPETQMPPWGTNGVFSDEEIRHIVAFLKTLTAPTVFTSELDDPNTRPWPVEDRENRDSFVNPAAEILDGAGEDLYAQAGPNGQACASCHADADALKAWPGSMPKWEPRLDKMLGVEEFVARHAKATMDADWYMQSDENLTMAVYLRSIANDQPIAPDVTSPQAVAALARAEDMTRRKIGQLNLACVDCHETGAGTWARGQALGEFEGQLPHFPTWRTSRSEIWDIRKRFQWCGVAIRANELPPDAPEYGDLELFLAAKNQGLEINVPGIRH